MRIRSFLLGSFIGTTLNLFITQATVYGQRSYNYFSLGPSVGIAHYQGDLDNNSIDWWRALMGKNKMGNPLHQIRPTFGAVINYHFHPYMYWRLTFNQAWLAGSDSNDPDPARRARNLSFSTAITEASLQLVYEFFAADYDYSFRHAYRLNWSPYVFSGISFFHFNPKAQPDPEWVKQYPQLFKDDSPVELRPLGTEGQYLNNPANKLPKPYSLNQFAIPMGIGIRRKLSHLMDLRFEIGMRKTFTDYIDDVSGAVNGSYYADPAAFTEQGKTVAGLFADRSRSLDGYATKAKRGDRYQDDWYCFSQFILTVILDRGDRCAQPYRGSNRR